MNIWFILEATRKYPGGGYIERFANEDYLVRKGGHKIEKGSSIFISIWGIHNDPDIYPDPATFNPDRMSRDQMNQRHPSSFIPFSIGPRSCPAQKMVNLQVKLGIVCLLINYRLSVNIRTKRTGEPRISNLKAETWLNIEPL